MRPKFRQVDHFVEAARAIVELMREYGVSQGEAEDRVLKAVHLGYKSTIAAEKETGRISLLADVCKRWHMDKNFIDGFGRPLPLTWNGKSGSLLKLAARVVGRSKARNVVDALIDRRLVRGTTERSWLPKSPVVSPNGLDRAQVLRTAQMVSRLLRTVIHNAQLRYKGDVLLEVMAEVPRLPARHLSAFKRFSKAQGIGFIKAIDDWLESRNVAISQSQRKATREVGMIAVAFVQPPRVRGARGNF